MTLNKKVISLSGAVFIFLGVLGQYNENSPYSLYGIGDIDRSGFASNRSMGGTAIGIRTPNQINYLNPASYNEQDTMSFIWDIGLFGLKSTAATNSVSLKRFDFNFSHIAMSFPVSRQYYVSLGLIPYSTVGYKIQNREIDPDSGITNYYYRGSGNLNQLYFGNSIGFLKKKLNVGFNISYIFGSLNTDNILADSISTHTVSTYIERRFMASGLHMNFGVQYKHVLSNKTILVAGATYDLKSKISLDYSDFVLRDVGGYNDTLAKAGNWNTGYYTIPAKIGIGISTLYNNKLLVGFDFTFQDWSKARFLNKKDTVLKSNSRFCLGLQYTPNAESYRSYFEKIRYRMGCYYNDGYINIKNTPIKDYGVTFGLGFPFRNTKTMFTFGVEMGHHGTKSKNLVEIDYSRITFSFTLYDFWFIKRKFN
jgi:hypothetical protein